MASEANLAWAAGLFDGEGCIHIGYRPPSRKNDLRNPYYLLTVKVTMGDKGTVEKFCKIMGEGTVQNHVARNERMNASYSWIAQSKKAYKALLLLRPYLVTKATEADTAIEFSELPSGNVGGSGGNSPLDPILLQKKHDLMIVCAELKSRYRFRRNPIPSKPEVFEISIQRQRKRDAKNKVS